MVTYGDGLGNIDITSLVTFHRSHGKLATITAVRPPARFGELVLDGSMVKEFAEKPQTRSGWINGGFFVFEPAVFDYLDETSPSSAVRSNASPPRGSSWPSGTRASGNPWIRCVRRISWRASGNPVAPRGEFGRTSDSPCWPWQSNGPADLT